METDELLMWADDGAWFQYRDEYGRIRTSYLGHCDSLEGLTRFAAEHGIPLRVFPKAAQHPAARAAKAQKQGRGPSPAPLRTPEQREFATA